MGINAKIKNYFKFNDFIIWILKELQFIILANIYSIIFDVHILDINQEQIGDAMDEGCCALFCHRMQVVINFWIMDST